MPRLLGPTSFAISAKGYFTLHRTHETERARFYSCAAPGAVVLG